MRMKSIQRLVSSSAGILSALIGVGGRPFVGRAASFLLEDMRHQEACDVPNGGWLGPLLMVATSGWRISADVTMGALWWTPASPEAAYGGLWLSHN